MERRYCPKSSAHKSVILDNIGPYISCITYIIYRYYLCLHPLTFFTYTRSCTCTIFGHILQTAMNVIIDGIRGILGTTLTKVQSDLIATLDSAGMSLSTNKWKRLSITQLIHSKTLGHGIFETVANFTCRSSSNHEQFPLIYSSSHFTSHFTC